jgi:hypothetical protein
MIAKKLFVSDQNIVKVTDEWKVLLSLVIMELFTDSLFSTSAFP